ncbi:MAG: CPBP family intramembrane metalloprotease [bacterium]|nr:CPBP family intramembrane metalloprotease [bacterium]
MTYSPTFNMLLASLSPDIAERAAAAILYLGLGVTTVAVLRHARRHGSDPFVGAPLRRHRISGTAAIVPIIGFILASALFGAVLGARGGAAPSEAAGLSANSLAQLVGAALCLWVAAEHYRGGAPRFLWGNGEVVRPVGGAVLYLFAAGALCEVTAVATKWMFQFFDPAYTFNEHQVIEALRDPSEPSWAPAALWIGAAVIAPVAEECFFRGVLQSMLLRLLRKRWLALLIPAVWFGLAHSTQMHVVPAMILFGVILGIQYERSGCLLGPIVLHALFNLRTLTWQSVTAGQA